MPRVWIPLAAAGVIAAGVLAMAGRSPAASPDAVTRGRQLFAANCAVCHGEQGDGGGMATHMLVVPPRDFRRGTFKFRSTPTGSLPTDADLFQTVTDGLRWTGMVGRPDLSAADRRALVAFIKTFSPRFTLDQPRAPVHIPTRPPTTAALVREGKAIYADAGCGECHGAAGRGDGPSARGQRDAWGHPTRPSDLTWRPLKRGADATSVYRTIVTGLDGTPMPSYAEALDPNQVWALVAFLETLVPSDHRVPPASVLGEERTAWMMLRMGMMGMGMMRGRMMR